MKNFVLSFFRHLIDLIFLILSIPSALVLYSYRRIGSQRLKITTGMLKRIGVFPIRNHYYEPMFVYSENEKASDINRELPGIDLNVEEQLKYIKSMEFSNELLNLKLEHNTESNLEFFIDNSVYGPGDADFLYQFIRTARPGKIIEIGSGYSTRIAILARNKNFLEGYEAEHICIEPYEASWLDDVEGIDLIRSPVENCSFDWSTELKSGDLLFIDSSHMIRPYGDVLEEYLNIIPRLQDGVFIHIHDIFTPRNYPDRWLSEHVFFWNEQYLLEVLLSNQSRYEVVAALNFLYHNYFEDLNTACPYLSRDVEPGAFYFRVKSTD